jgi:MFS transporter, MHS family, shikimate and dehydroshikimate transport protein
MRESSFLSWGWRLPFLFSIILVVVGVLTRWKIAESPAFTAVEESGQRVALPGVTVLTHHWRVLLLAIGTKLGEVTLFYLATVFALSYAKTTLGMPRQQVLNAIMIAAALACVTIPLFGIVGDRFGQRRVFALGALYLAAFAIPMFWLMDSSQPALFLLAIIGAIAICQPSMYALLPSLFAAQFPAEVRCSGVSLCFQIAAAIGGAVAPLAATWLLARFGTTLPIAAYLIALGLLAAICAMSMRPVQSAALHGPA